MIEIKINSDVRKESMGRLIWVNTPVVLDQTREHYQLLRFITKQFPYGSKIADLGSAFGASAFSFADTLPHINVVSYDLVLCSEVVLGLRENGITTLISPSLPPPLSNISFKVGDVTKCVNEYVDSDLILLDISDGVGISRHSGIQEQNIFDQLIKLGFKGLLLLDDIHSNEGMETFWQGIPLKKYDITKYGHLGNYGSFRDAGTGIVVFDEETISVVIE